MATLEEEHMMTLFGSCKSLSRDAKDKVSELSKEPLKVNTGNAWTDAKLIKIILTIFTIFIASQPKNKIYHLVYLMYPNQSNNLVKLSLIDLIIAG